MARNHIGFSAIASCGIPSKRFLSYASYLAWMDFSNPDGRKLPLKLGNWRISNKVLSFCEQLLRIGMERVRSSVICGDRRLSDVLRGSSVVDGFGV